VAIPGRRLLLGLVAVFLLAVVPSVVVPTLMCRPADPQLDVLGTIPAFALVDERGQPFTAEALHGEVTIVSFIFTRCDSICPVTTMKMQKIAEKTDDVGNRIKLLSISVDPAYDTPARLTEYAHRYQADPARWRFVTGEPAAVQALVEGPFMNSMQRSGNTPSGAPNIAHGGRFMLIDGELRIRGAYDSNDIHKLDEMLRDARFLARTGS
jgi:protein SCO1/2